MEKIKEHVLVLLFLLFVLQLCRLFNIPAKMNLSSLLIQVDESHGFCQTVLSQIKVMLGKSCECNKY